MVTDDARDAQDHDLLMPGFRFHPTEEELVDFYLRRKVEGKRFHVDLIASLDLYRYDPWELPAMAAIGGKEWFFYVPRDRKYRNGDRPNRVTTSGYWKATGADRTVRNASSTSIGLKKTLVFYTGRAPKGVRTSWIMNEYRLPHTQTDPPAKGEISLCRVYKRPGVDETCRVPPNLSSKAAPLAADPINRSAQGPSSSFPSLPSSTDKLVLGNPALYPDPTLLEDDSLLPPTAPTDGELHRLVCCGPMQHFPYSSQEYQPPPHPPGHGTVPVSLSTISEKLWEWNASFK
ncbi:hypothetical protein HPP92_001032 [Vanilla planifolia]|uniref:NAC domain-containing protein n=1 Tax=Vanilla planifolia TaxID=51239 RepID=A0A835RVU5_VANPL|nr:hypothetical protein HPP92_001205 [Vanilla planifolia]KAG0500960.1 hypothetical protein HPP92_001032 [Vanilla planifolia]